jgi:amino acid adenylation domain-containing protein
MVTQTGSPPLSFAQERLWFLNRLQPHAAAYNVAIALHLEGLLGVAALERALGEIVRRHDTLRTTFQERDGGPVQVVAPFAGFTIPIEDLSRLGTAAEATVERRIRTELEQPYDLGRGPLLRPALLRLGPEEHVLLLGLHHVVIDGWSRRVLFKELSVLYAHYRHGGDAPPLPVLPMQYADYAVWQRETVHGDVLTRELTYWRAQLAGAPELMALPTDRPRPSVQTYGGARELMELSPALVERLRALARRERVTLFMVLLSAFQVLLSKYSGTDDVVVGTPVAGRTPNETEELIGFFANTLVLRTDLGGNPAFRDVLRRARGVTIGAYEHRQLPFEKLVAELRPERSLSHSPVFQVMLSLYPANDTALELPGLRVRDVPAESRAVAFDLVLDFSLRAHGLDAVLTYSTDLFDPSTARRMLRHLERVLTQVVTDADVCVADLELLDGSERQQLLYAWNETQRPYPSDRCLHELFEAQAARSPASIAVRYQGDALTYAELNARANQLAQTLSRVGVAPEVRVGLYVERSPDVIIGILGVLKAGGAYVPLATDYPAERLEFMLRDAGVSAIVTQERMRTALPPCPGAAIVTVDGTFEATDARRAAPPPCRAVADNLCYVMYTSGSTGRPKGVLVTHRSVVNLLEWAQQAFDVGPATRLAQVTTPSFDISVLEFFLPLIGGGQVCMVSDRDRQQGVRLGARLAETQATLMQATPSTWRSIVEEEWRPPVGFRALCGGEAMPVALASSLAEGHGEVWNLYGPTETTIWSCAYRLAPPLAGRVPIGRPLANTRGYVVDDCGEPVPVGVPGELWLGGAGVTRGYQGHPRITAERFVPDPFGGESGGRVYRTGDRARWRPDGTLEFLGRLDAQVKLRGCRIELGEVEAALSTCTGVREARVVVRTDTPREPRLAAYVVGRVDADALRAHLRRVLPEHMIPGAFVQLPALPLTPTGKLDVKALPAPDLETTDDEYVAPRTPVERALVDIWAEVLRLDRVGVTDNFFARGGHSLAAMRVVSRIEDLTGLEFPVRALFERPTIQTLAAAVAEIESDVL